jgi:hypothetical protein
LQQLVSVRDISHGRYYKWEHLYAVVLNAASGKVISNNRISSLKWFIKIPTSIAGKKDRGALKAINSIIPRSKEFRREMYLIVD